MQRSKFNFHTVNFSFASGSAGSTISSGRLPEGKVIGAALYHAGNEPAEIVNLTLRQGGSQLFYGSDIRDWKRRSGGDYVSSQKPLNQEGARDYDLEFSVNGTLSADFKGQVVFTILKPNCEL